MRRGFHCCRFGANMKRPIISVPVDLITMRTREVLAVIPSGF